MKDYYQILGVPDNANQEQIRSAFRKLAFKHHPDTCPGDKKQAEEKFKEINEAYGVLGDESKRQEYDSARNGHLAGYDAKYGGFRYSQQDIFRDIFSNPAMFDELNQMFSQAGLRFDHDFFNQVFFRSGGVAFRFSVGPSGINRRVYRFGASPTDGQYPLTEQSAYRPSWMERFLSGIAMKAGRFALRHLFGVQFEPEPRENLDQHIELEISPAEAVAGAEKVITHKRGNNKKKLVVKIPPGVKSGTKIRLRGASAVRDKKPGDLYLQIKVKS